ncbi:cobalamin-dependent protein [Chitinispirillales bacterium ANBcel5]|uniref:B12-binding domain-containing radical SAM protein n=1 Tax=Cellulosispirillum alkaliphilum TaxID=3039283 RepID=UPI002A561038|nr:cobalamin-dependent protein [Chitinispirillales bacterium ANBcel5]
MKVALIGPELEENLALRYIHSSLSKANHHCRIFDFHSADQTGSIIDKVLLFWPELVGLSMVFTARAREYMELCNKLRLCGYNGHITAGGHFASFHAQQLLNSFISLDTIIHGEGEIPILELASNLENVSKVSNVSYRNKEGSVCRTSGCPNITDLDSLEPPTRTPPFQTYLTLPIANILGSRGCYAHCNFCSISAWHKENGGERFRARSARAVGEEMASLYHDHGVRIFNFHDDNFFLPSEKDNLERFSTLRKYLDSYNMGKIAIQVKARPDSISRPVVTALKKLGLFRVFLGIENNAVGGLKALGRNCTLERNYRALEILENNDIHTTFNLLIFEPEMTPGDLAENISLFNTHPHYPVNFGRVEVYSGTPLEKQLRAQNRLLGDYFGYNYSISDERMQRAYEIFRKVFTGRNFDVNGLNFLCMQLDYYYHLLKHFYPQKVTPGIKTASRSLISDLNHNSAKLLGSILNFVTENPNANSVKVKQLGDDLLLWREKYDQDAKDKFRNLIDEIKSAASNTQQQKRISAAGKAAKAAAAALLLVTTINCNNPVDKDWHTNEMIANPLDDPHFDWDTTSPVQQFQADRVRSRILSIYRQDLYSLLKEHEFIDKEVHLDVLLDTAGTVISYRIALEDEADSLFAAELGELVSKWHFSNVDRFGKCSVNLKMITLQYPRNAIKEFHMFEIIAEPHDYYLDKNPAEPFTVSFHDTVWNQSLWENFHEHPQIVKDELLRQLDSIYVENIDNIVKEHIRNSTMDITIDMILDINGRVTMFRIKSEHEDYNEQLKGLLNREIASWVFPNIYVQTGTKILMRRAGKVSIRINDLSSEQLISEIITTDDKQSGKGDTL